MNISSPSPSSSSMLTIGPLAAAPGQKVSGVVPIASNHGDEHHSTDIPMTILKSNNDGPILLVLAGIHGSEYTPIVATQRLAQDLDPTQIDSGGLILVHVANLPSYRGRTVYNSPVDGLNLNRVFPGRPEGNLTERVANFLVTQVYPQAQFVMDVHSGDANEQLGPSYTAYYGHPEYFVSSPSSSSSLPLSTQQIVQSSREMAYAFGTDVVIEFPPYNQSIWAGSAAIAMGIPSIDVEMAPGMGRYDDATIEDAYQGILRVMMQLGILESSQPIITTRHDHHHSSTPCLVTERHFLSAPPTSTEEKETVIGEDDSTTSSWVPLVDTGTMVSEGTLLGYTTDLFGTRNYEVRAPRDGLLLIRFESPPVQPGDTLAVLAVLNISDSGCEQLRQRWTKSKTKIADHYDCTVWQWIAVSGWIVILSLLGTYYFFFTRKVRIKNDYPYDHATTHDAECEEETNHHML